MFSSHVYGQRLILMCHATHISRGGAKHTQGCRGDPNACELGHFWHAKVHLGHTTAYVCQPRVLPGLGLGTPCRLARAWPWCPMSLELHGKATNMPGGAGAVLELGLLWACACAFGHHACGCTWVASI